MLRSSSNFRIYTLSKSNKHGIPILLSKTIHTITLFIHPPQQRTGKGFCVFQYKQPYAFNFFFVFLLISNTTGGSKFPFNQFFPFFFSHRRHTPKGYTTQYNALCLYYAPRKATQKRKIENTPKKEKVPVVLCGSVPYTRAVSKLFLSAFSSSSPHHICNISK